MFRLVCMVIGYGFGCLQSAYFVGRLFGKIDIREHGSGNAGMTNVTRVMGAKAGLAVFVFDVCKAVLAYTICSLLFKGSGNFTAGESYLPGLYAGLGVILGHDFPFYMKFKGGKGAASTIGLVIMFDWRIMLICFGLGLVAALATQYISFGAMVVFVLFPIGMAIFGFPAEVIALGVAIAAVGCFQHRANIVRLLHGKENKFSIKKKGE